MGSQKIHKMLHGSTLETFGYSYSSIDDGGGSRNKFKLSLPLDKNEFRKCILHV